MTRHSNTSRIITIGRSRDNDVVLDFPNISWNHARIIQDESGLFIEDLRSTNGTAVHTLLNRVQTSPISFSDLLFFGSYRTTAADLLGITPGAMRGNPDVTL